MRVTDLYLSEGITNLPNDPRPVIVGPQNVITPFFVPAAINIGLTIGFIDVKVGDTASVSIFNHKDEPLISLPEIKITKELIDVNIPSHQNGIFMNSMVQNLIIKEEAKVKIVVKMSNEKDFVREYDVFAREKSK